MLNESMRKVHMHVPHFRHLQPLKFMFPFVSCDMFVTAVGEVSTSENVGRTSTTAVRRSLAVIDRLAFFLSHFYVDAFHLYISDSL